jgi:hypothetical protein
MVAGWLLGTETGLVVRPAVSRAVWVKGPSVGRLWPSSSLSTEPMSDRARHVRAIASRLAVGDLRITSSVTFSATSARTLSSRSAAVARRRSCSWSP